MIMTQNATVKKKKTNKQNEIYKMIIIAQFIHEVYWYLAYTLSDLGNSSNLIG